MDEENAMSGGYWGYVAWRIKDSLQEISEDEIALKRWPTISKIFENLAEIIYHSVHEMELDLSGDSHIPDDKEFDIRIAREILTSVVEACPKKMSLKRRV